MLAEFHQKGKLNREINATFVAFIPKLPNTVALTNFRPASLVGCVYKLFQRFWVID